MTAGEDMPAPQVFDERVVTRILGHDVKVAGGIGSHGAADVVGEGEVEGVPPGGSEAHQLHRGGVLEKLFDQGNIELRLTRAYQQREADGLARNDREVNLMDVLEINEDVVYRGWEIGGNGRHTILTQPD